MKLKSSTSKLFLLCLMTASAVAQISVTSPINGGSVPMPVWVRAHVPGCGGNLPTAFGYSVDNSPFITWGITSYDIDTTDYRMNSPGTYTIHFKAWAGSVQCSVVDSAVTVTGPTTTANSSLLGDSWKWVFDTGTSGSASGSTAYPVASPSYDSHSRSFSITSYSNGGGMRGSTTITGSSSATHFVYDAYVYLTNPGSVQNVEMDTNQIDGSGNVLIFGLQCAAGSGSWEYTTVTNNATHWYATNPKVTCNPQQWAANTWHHVQLAVHATSGTNVAYDSVTFDGKTSNFPSGTSGYSYFVPAAGQKWQPAWGIIPNFQLDSKIGGTGTITAYVDGMTMIYW